MKTPRAVWFSVCTVSVAVVYANKTFVIEPTRSNKCAERPASATSTTVSLETWRPACEARAGPGGRQFRRFRGGMGAETESEHGEGPVVPGRCCGGPLRGRWPRALAQPADQWFLPKARHEPHVAPPWDRPGLRWTGDPSLGLQRRCFGRRGFNAGCCQLSLSFSITKMRMSIPTPPRFGGRQMR